MWISDMPLQATNLVHSWYEHIFNECGYLTHPSS